MQDLSAIAATLQALQAQVNALQGISDDGDGPLGFLVEIPEIKNIRYVSLSAEGGTVWHFREDGKNIPIPMPALRGIVTKIECRHFEATDKWGDAWKLNVTVEAGSDVYVLQCGTETQSGKTMLKSLGGADLSHPVTFVPTAGENKTVFVNVIDRNGRIFTKDLDHVDAARTLARKGILQGDTPWNIGAPFNGIGGGRVKPGITSDVEAGDNTPSSVPPGFEPKAWVVAQKAHLEKSYGVTIPNGSVKDIIEGLYGLYTKAEQLTWDQCQFVYRDMAATAQTLSQMSTSGQPEAF